MYYSVGKASGDQIFLIMWSSSDNLLQIVTGPTQQLNSDKLCLKVFNWWTDMVQNLAEYKQWTEGVGFCIGWSCLRLFVPLVTQACSAVTSTRWRLYQPTFDPCVGFKGFVQPYGLRAVCNQQQGRKCKDRTIPQYGFKVESRGILPVGGNCSFQLNGGCCLRENSYQLDFVTPGRRQLWAISRKRCLERPKSRKYPFGLPVNRHRLCNRVALLSRGNSCNFRWMVNFSSNSSVVLISFFKSSRFFL